MVRGRRSHYVTFHNEPITVCVLDPQQIRPIVKFIIYPWKELIGARPETDAPNLMDEPIPILMNTKSGAIHEEAGEQQLYRMAEDADVLVRVIKTQSIDDLQRELSTLIDAKAPKVAIAGGDGTVGLAVQLLANSETALGILSQGTFNNFASAVRMHHNLPAALKTLKDGEVKHVDLGKVGDRYFTESAGIGLFADALAAYGQGSNKNVVRGLLALGRIALSFHPHPVNLTIDGQQTDERITICEICNTYRIAQAVPIAPEADIDDGYLDVVTITDLHRHELPGYLKALRAQMHLGLPQVTVTKAREVRIEADRTRNVHADDHLVGRTPVTVTVQPGALRVLVDAKL